MAKNKTSQSIVSSLPGVLLIALVAGGLTYGGKMAVAEATKPKPVEVKTVVVTETESEADAKAEAEAAAATKAAAAKAAAEPAPVPAPAVTTKTATTNSFVYLRPTASTSGTALQGLQAGTAVQYETVTPGLWQKVTVGGQAGYVYKKWLTY